MQNNNKAIVQFCNSNSLRSFELQNNFMCMKIFFQVELSSDHKKLSVKGCTTII